MIKHNISYGTFFDRGITLQMRESFLFPQTEVWDFKQINLCLGVLSVLRNLTQF